MTAALHHRGPDAGGLWLDREAGAALGHRRLAIVDLSDAGHQPMLSHGERFVMTFNGEVYNFADLRIELERLGHRFRGHSDTEIMLAAFESFGIERALNRFAGMFALGVWDRAERVLYLVRDRIGKKPLYVAVVRGALVFASELRAIRAFPGFHPVVDPNALAAVLRRGWVPDHCCIWKGVFKLPPGTMLSIRADDLKGGTCEELRERVRRWWSLADVAEAGQRSLIGSRPADIEAELDCMLRRVVRERMVADVPLGAFLSGGIDSSTVVALMQAQSSRPVRTFTIGFCEAGYDEARHATAVARRFGTEHTEFRLTPDEALAVIPDLPRIWDEPFADESQIPTFLLARLARQHVTVTLSGDGGDECFGGYTRHIALARLASLVNLPAVPRRLIASILRMVAALPKLVRRLPVPAELCTSLNVENLQKLAGVLRADGECELYDQLMTVAASPLTLGAEVAVPGRVPQLPDLVSRLMFRDMAGYLPGDILVKLDRASMAVSLETRCPFLDHRIIEFAWRLPSALKVRTGQGKWLLRQVLRRYLPDMLCERPKQGFNVPIGAWLNGPLRDWAQGLIESIRSRGDGFLDFNLVQACWHDHLRGEGDRSRELWAILMVQAWLEITRRPDAARPPLTLVESATPAAAGMQRAYGG
jgi:asparagine synthase (glutamine-hydrolysing)